MAFERIFEDADFFSGEHGGEDEFGHVFGERRDCREYERGRAAEKNGHGKRLSECFGLVVVEAAALVYLPVHAGGLRVEALHSVDAEVVSARRGVLGVDERQREEGAAVLLPCCEHGQFVEPGRSV